MKNKTLSAILLGSALAFNSCENERKEQFLQEKVLTISADEYCRNVGKNISDYKFVGVFGAASYYSPYRGGLINMSWNNLPLETEVVVNYNEGRFGCHGTALVPKNK